MNKRLIKTRRIEIEFDLETIAVGIIGGRDGSAGYKITLLIPFFWITFKLKNNE